MADRKHADAIAPAEAEVFRCPLDGCRTTLRAPLNALLTTSGFHRLTKDSPAEDVRDASERLRDEIIGARLDQLDRATVLKLALDVLGQQRIPRAARILHAALDDVTAPPRDRTASEAKSLLPDDEPAKEPTPCADLLDQTEALIHQHVVVSAAQARTIALWVGATFVIDALDLLPYLLVSAPTMRAGKTTLLTLLSVVVPRALQASNLTPAALARIFAAHRPTLLADEAETWLTNEASQLRGVMNAGHTRAGASIVRCAPETHEPVIIPCFGPRVIAMIGRPPSTIVDRSILVALKRKRPSETVKRMRLDRLPEQHKALRQGWRRWANDHIDVFRSLDPQMPAGLHDRAEDNWRPLIAVADQAGDEWPAQARAAAIELSRGAEAEESIVIDLLRDIREAFTARGRNAVPSQELVAALVVMSDRPWATFGRNGQPITQAKLAQLLNGMDIVPSVYREGKRTPRGYRRAAFEDAFQRYLPEDCNSATPPAFAVSGSSSPTPQLVVHVAPPESSTQPVFTNGCCGVAPQSGDVTPGILFSLEDGIDD